jgi:hypothetical protein
MKTYTFYVGTAPAGDVISRTLELPADWTLEDLSDAIQEAFGLDGQEGFSFYMSGEAWDESTEYTHLDELWDEDELWEEDEADAEAMLSLDDLPAEDEPATEPVTGPLTLFEEAETALETPTGTPSAQDIRSMFAELKNNPELRAQLTAQMADQLKLPAFMLDAVLSNADSLLALLPDDQLTEMVAGLDPQGDAEGPIGDTRETRLADLGLEPGGSFLYMYDYDEERYFEVHLESVQEPAEPEEVFPRVLESSGELPPFEDDEE